MHRLRAAALLALALSAAAMGEARMVDRSASAPGSLADGSRIASNGRWLVDATGRVVMIRGGNVIQLVGDVHHHGPGAGKDPWNADTPRLMAQAGFNGVRLAIFMDRVAPAPGRIDQAYLDAVAATVAAYRQQGIVTLIDFHQDEYSAMVGMRGMPDWMTLTGGLRRDPALSFPNGYFRDPAVKAAFDNFWANAPVASGKGVQDAYLDGVAAVARRFADDPAVFGIDLMNEPATGTPCSQPDPRSANCPALEQKLLAPFYAKAARVVTAAAPRLILFVEPFMLQGALGIPIDTPLPDIGTSGLSFHNYGPFRPTREKVSDTVLALAVRRKAPLINTEWGFSNDAADLAAQGQDFDNRLISWLAWARGPFEALVNPAAGLEPALNREQVLRAYARPYPARTAGTPVSLAFDADRALLDYRWSTLRPDGTRRNDLPTEIRMPRSSYPQGYAVEAYGGRVVSAPNAATLLILADKGAAEVHVRVKGIATLAPLMSTAQAVRPGLSVDSLVGDLLKDPAAKAVLGRYLPTLTASKEIGLAPQISLRAMQPYLPEMNDAVLAKIDAELAALPKKP